MPEEQLNTMATSNHNGNNNTPAGEETSPLLLSKWIHHAVTTVDLSHITNNTEATNYLGSNPQLWPANIRLSMALCSEEYLMSALNVAYSLADQICLLEGGGGGVLNNGDNINNYCSSEADSINNDNNVRMMLPSLPPAGSSWTDSIQIHLSTTTTTNGLHEINNGSPINKVTAKFSSTTMNNNKEGGGGNIEDYMQRLYSLGVVFYEIFSGGERPINVVSATTATTAPTGATTTTTETLTSSLSQEISENNITLDLFDYHDEIIGGDGSGGPPTIGLLGKGGDALGLEGLIFDDVPDAADDDYNHLLRHGDDEAADNDGVNNNGGIPRKRQITQQNHGGYNNNTSNSNTMSSVSIVEPLKAKGIPVSLCDMIVNMMDCTYGTLRGQDAYHSMMEVRDDLRLMLDRPDLYLYDQDMVQLSSTGLQLFGGSSFGRNAELATIKDAYELYNVTINLYV